MTRSLAFVIFAGAILTHFPLYAASTRHCEITYARESIPWQGLTVTIERYQPIGRSIGLVLMIHGSAGALTRYPDTDLALPVRDNFGEIELARNCFTVTLPHYFEAIGRKSTTDLADLEAEGPALLEFLNSFLAASPDRGKSVPSFLYGESFGGFLAVAMASQRNDVWGVSEFGGGLPDTSLGRRMPPILIQHGESDSIVPLSESKKLQTWARERTRVVIKIYPGQDHYFDETTRKQILATTIDFFRGLSAAKRDQK